MNRIWFALLVACLPVWAWSQERVTIFIDKGSEWKYYDKEIFPGDNWLKKNFKDETWASGKAELGYGDDDEKTVISHGTNSNKKTTTAYFRKTIEIESLDGYKTVELNIRRDDGAVVYINGEEVYRTNMPAGKIKYNTLASSALSGGNESIYVQAFLEPKVLQKGKNVIAVEVHQDNIKSSDLSFDLSLRGSKSTGIVRGPYLQSGTPTSVIVRYRTSSPVSTKINYGLSTSFTDSIVKEEEATDHVIQLEKLQPNTKYYYSVSSAKESSNPDNSIFFITPPLKGSVQPVRIWTMGDFGSTGAEQIAARDQYYDFSKDTYTNLFLWLGDDAYPKGTDEQYSTNVFIPYRKILAQSLTYSSTGNHDLFSSNVEKETGPYFDIFSFPKNGECGGVASGSEAYYSFDYANIHFICLESNIDSFGEKRSGEMLQWLKSDLEKNSSKWTIAYFHFAIYSKGYHDSDKNKNMIWMRTNVAPILERHNVDLILAGHLHDYERTPLLNGYYGEASTLAKTMIVDKGTGSDPVQYKKKDKGTMYLIAGCMGESQPVNKAWPHPANAKSFQKIFGTVVIDINDSLLTGKLLTKDGKIEDHFTITK